MNLKQVLINYNIAIDNKYLELYCDLIIKNKNTQKRKFETAAHHVIPVNYYITYYNLDTRKSGNTMAKQDSNNFIVNLSHADHLLAHLFLAAASSNAFKAKNSYAFNRLLGTGNRLFKNSLNIYETLDENELIIFQQLQIEANKQRAKNTKQQHKLGIHKMTAAQKEKIRQASSNRISVVNVEEDRHYIKPEELQHYLNLGYKRGAYFNKKNNPHIGMKRSDKTKANISAAAKTRKKHIYSEEEMQTIAAKISKANEGKPKSETTRKKLQITSSKLKSWTNGNILIRSVVCPGPTFRRGLPDKMRQDRCGKKWYTDGKNSILIKQDEIAKYVNIGFYPGRCSRTKN